MEIWGLLLTPSERCRGATTAASRVLHGGPGGGFTHGLFPQFMHIVPQVDPYPTAAMASAGFAVLFPMPRGGAGYGEAGQRAIVNAWGDADYKDIMTGVDALIAQGIADPRSARRHGRVVRRLHDELDRRRRPDGSRRRRPAPASAISTTPTICPRAASSWSTTSSGPGKTRRLYAAHSPMTYADKVTTPLLIQHGEVDPRVPIAGAWKCYRALKGLGKTVEFDIYPRGGHVLREPMQQREQMKREPRVVHAVDKTLTLPILSTR